MNDRAPERNARRNARRNAWVLAVAAACIYVAVILWHVARGAA